MSSGEQHDPEAVMAAMEALGEANVPAELPDFERMPPYQRAKWEWLARIVTGEGEA